MRNLEYRKLWVGNAASNLSDGLVFIAMPLIATTLSKDPLAVSGLTVAYTVPRIGAVLGIGVMIDRFDRRHLLYVANLLRFLAYGALAILLVKGAVNLPLLYVIYAAVALVETTSDTAVFSVLPSIIPAKELDRANSQITGAQLVIDEFVGPPLGGFLFAVTAALPIGASSFACGVASLAFFLLRGPYRGSEAGAERTSIWNDLSTGLAWLRRNEIVAGLVAINGLASVAYSLPFSFLVVFAQRVLGLDSGGYGLMMSFSALGGLLGSFVSPRLRQRFGYGTGIVLALFLGAVSITICGATSNTFVAAVAMAAYICHAVVWSVLASSVRQKIIPQDLLGRIGSAGRLLSYLGLATGAAAGGWMAATLDLRVPFYVSGLCFLGCVAISVRLHGAIRAWESAQEETAVTE